MALMSDEARRLAGKMSGAEAEAMRRLREEAVAQEPRIAAVRAERAERRARAEREAAERRAQREALKRQGQPGRMYRREPEFKVDHNGAARQLEEAEQALEAAQQVRVRHSRMAAAPRSPPWAIERAV